MLAKLGKQVSSRIAARIELREDIPALPSGKYKWVVQECSRNTHPPRSVQANAVPKRISRAAR